MEKKSECGGEEREGERKGESEGCLEVKEGAERWKKRRIREGERERNRKGRKQERSI